MSNNTHFKITFHKKVLDDDIPKISKTNLKRIKKAIDRKLKHAPAIYGKPLRSPLQGFFKLRIGDYRIIYKILQKEVRILTTQHRSVVYKDTHRLK